MGGAVCSALSFGAWSAGWGLGFGKDEVGNGNNEVVFHKNEVVFCKIDIGNGKHEVEFGKLWLSADKL
jgi:hypothetical protein